MGNACDIENIAPLNEVQVTNNYKTTETKLREFADGSEDLGTGLEIAGIAGAPVTEGGSLAVLGTLGEISTAIGTTTNAGLDIYNGKYTSAFGRIFVFGATLGLGKAIKSLEEAGRIQKIDSKILDANKLINEKTMERSYDNMTEPKNDDSIELPDSNKQK